jgi:hypothetical protein
VVSSASPPERRATAKKLRTVLNIANGPFWGTFFSMRI